MGLARRAAIARGNVVNGGVDEVRTGCVVGVWRVLLLKVSVCTAPEGRRGMMRDAWEESNASRFRHAV